MTGPEGPDIAEPADYVLLPRAAFFEFLGSVALPPWPDADGNLVLGGDVDCAPLAEGLAEWVRQNDLSGVCNITPPESGSNVHQYDGQVNLPANVQEGYEGST